MPQLEHPPQCTSDTVNQFFAAPPVHTPGLGVTFFPPNLANMTLSTAAVHPALSLAAVQTPLPKHFSWRADSNVDLHPPPNQAACGSCWAMSSTTALSDRFAIKYGIKNPLLSTTNTLSCAAPIDYKVECNTGGLPFDAGKLFEADGIKTSRCWPYSIVARHNESVPCVQRLGPGCCVNCCMPEGGDSKNLSHNAVFKALRGSTQNLYAKDYDAQATTALIQHDILNFGPVVATFWVYSDFQNWWAQGAPGIYFPNSSSGRSGGHAVVLTGWGEEMVEGKRVRYWEMRNSWGMTGLDGTGYCKMAFSLDIPDKMNWTGLDVPVRHVVSDPYFGGVTRFEAGPLPDFKFEKFGKPPVRPPVKPPVKPPVNPPSPGPVTTNPITEDWMALGVSAGILGGVFLLTLLISWFMKPSKRSSSRSSRSSRSFRSSSSSRSSRSSRSGSTRSGRSSRA